MVTMQPTHPANSGSREHVAPHVLARILFAGVRHGPPARDPTPGALTVPLSPLPGSAEYETWIAARPVESCMRDGIVWSADGVLSFASVSVAGAGGDGIEAATTQAYRRLFSAVDSAGYPHALRVWNLVPGINEVSGATDRYRRFCRARAGCFAERMGDGFHARLPSASAVGCEGDRLVVQMLAGRDPGRHVENPRQVPSYHYPESYGPWVPSFARATVLPPGAGRALLISGTASIVRSESCHPGDPVAQTEETLRNLSALIDAADLPGARGPLSSRLDSLRVYVRRSADATPIRRTLERELGGRVPAVFVRADICRAELLVEIEGVARY